MTLTAAASFQPTTNVGIAPFAGSGAKSIIVNTVMDLAQTLITNYVNKQISGISKKAENASGEVIRKAFRYANQRSRTRYSSNTKYARKRYRTRGSRSRRRY